MSYKIVRYYFNGWPSKCRTIRTGLTLEEAQRHCEDPETSSSTCTTRAGLRRTKERGPWFDGYSDE